MFLKKNFLFYVSRGDHTASVAAHVQLAVCSSTHSPSFFSGGAFVSMSFGVGTVGAAVCIGALGFHVLTILCFAIKLLSPGVSSAPASWIHSKSSAQRPSSYAYYSYS